MATFGQAKEGTATTEAGGPVVAVPKFPGADSAPGWPAGCAIPVLEGGSVPGTAVSGIGGEG